ncbi:hypothetical protein [Shewanella scandinavica]|uniref:hypothetical protein n=1 Tax=Shewanella scandinavica TaxID=3063538 RepID=UPI00318E4842
MTNPLSWESIQDRENVRPEFGASHVNYAWRRHRQNSHKFENLENAFLSKNNNIVRLLQNLGGNINSTNYAERGNCLFIALWYPDSDWAILCNPTTATLVDREAVEALPITKQRDDELVESLRALFNSSSSELKRELNGSFYSQNIA